MLNLNRFSAFTVLLIVAPLASAETLFGVTLGGRFVSFDSASPSTFSTNVALTGLTAGDTLIGLDARPSNGLMYGLSQNGRLYTIDTATGAATLGSTLTGVTLPARASFGVDFNPMADRLRITSTFRDNFRANVDGGATLTDGVLTYAANDRYFYEEPTIAAVGYTNSVPNATSTSIYYIDANLDTLATALPANGGANGGVLTTVGALGFNATNLTDFEISGRTNVAYASVNVPGGLGSSLYSIDLTTGAGTLIGGFSGTDRIALIASQPVPEPATIAALGLGALGLLRRRRRA